MKQGHRYLVEYQINYPSGKKWKTKCEQIALSERGAIEIVKWLKSNYSITILSVQFIGFTGYITYDSKTLGCF